MQINNSTFKFKNKE